MKSKYNMVPTVSRATIEAFIASNQRENDSLQEWAIANLDGFTALEPHLSDLVREYGEDLIENSEAMDPREVVGHLAVILQLVYSVMRSAVEVEELEKEMN